MRSGSLVADSPRVPYPLKLLDSLAGLRFVGPLRRSDSGLRRAPPPWKPFASKDAGLPPPGFHLHAATGLSCHLPICSPGHRSSPGYVSSGNRSLPLSCRIRKPLSGFGFHTASGEPPFIWTPLAGGPGSHLKSAKLSAGFPIR